MRASLGKTETLPQSPETWLWKHFQNPFGESRIVVAELDGRIAGVRPYLRWRFLTPEGDRLEGLRAVDTATHPDFRRRGVFRAMTVEANRLAETEGFDLVFNTPNEASRPGYLSMGWVSVGKPRLYVRFRRPWSLTGRGDSGRIPPPEMVLDDAVELKHGQAYNDRTPLGLRTERTASYLRWRFVEHPTVPYLTPMRGSGIFVRPGLRRGRTELVVSELLEVRDEELTGLAKRARADYLVASFRTDSPEARMVRRHGFLPIPLTGLTLVALPFSSRATAARDLENWDLSLGDLELM